MKVHAVITAGGSGKRMGGEVRKQYLLLGNMPVLARTVAVLNGMDIISSVMIVCPGEDAEYIKKDIVDKYGFGKVSAVVQGGPERQDSVRNALEALECGPDDLIAIHDGVRPFVSPASISDAVKKASLSGASAVCVSLKDTVKNVSGGKIISTAERNAIMAVQTPQVFRAGLIRSCHEQALADGFYATDDCALVEKYSPLTEILTAEGDYFNFKITTAEDMIFAESVYRSGSSV